MVFLLVLARIFWDWLETSGDLKGKDLNFEELLKFDFIEKTPAKALILLIIRIGCIDF